MMRVPAYGALTGVQRCRSLAVVTVHQTPDARWCAPNERVLPKPVSRR